MSLFRRAVPAYTADGSRFLVRLGRVINWLFAAIGVLLLAATIYAIVAEADSAISSQREVSEWNASHPTSTPTEDGRYLYRVKFNGKDREVIGPHGASYFQLWKAINDAGKEEWPGALIMEGQTQYPPYIHTFTILPALFFFGFGALSLVLGRGARYLIANE